MSRHPTEALVGCCGFEVEVDVEMVPLILALWIHEVHTCNGCCQGDGDGPAWICFPDLEEADKFYEALENGGISPVEAGEALRLELRAHLPPSAAQVFTTFPRSFIARMVEVLTPEADQRAAQGLAEAKAKARGWEP